MASLDRMAIRGVRSFDDKRVSLVRFYTPLTVIQGANGSGKTTIIECLKYATTGDMPPNSKGGAFIHDPSMATANEVKAQVRLRFRNTNKVLINCVRNVQVTRKRGGGLTMKTLESLLQIEDENQTNKRTTLSTKCAELDQEVPQQLGVSRAILDNVIFCHQEENNWPLGEPSSLKKKFDDIFESARYQKAVDNLKSTRKDLATDNRVAQAQLEGLKTDKQRAEGIKEKMHSLQNELKVKDMHLKELNEKVAAVIHATKELNDKATRFRENVSRAESLEEKKEIYVANINALKQSMTPLNEDEDELRRRKAGFESHLSELRNRQDRTKAEIAKLKSDYAAMEIEQGRKLSEKGSLESEKKFYEKALEQREKAFKDVMIELNLTELFHSIITNDDAATKLMQKVKDELHRLRKEYDQQKQNSTKKENDLLERLQELKGFGRAKEASKISLSENLNRLAARLKRAQTEADEMCTADSDVDIARKDHQRLVEQLQELNNELARSNIDEKLRDKNAELRNLEDNRETLTSELNKLNRQADFRAKLDITRKSSLQKHREAQNLLQRHSLSLKRLVGQNLEQNTIEQDLITALMKKERELADLEGRAEESRSHAQHIESVLSLSRSQIAQKENLLRASKERIEKALDDEYKSLDDAVSQCQQEVEFIKKQISMYESMSEFFENAQKHSKERHVCLGCNRSIQSDEMASIESYISDMILKSRPTKREEYLQDIEGWQEQLDKFMDLRSYEMQNSSLEEEISNLSSQLQRSESDLQAAKAEAERLSKDVESRKNDLKELSHMKNIASDITRLQHEGNRLEKDANAIENDLRATGSIRTGDQVQQEIDHKTNLVKCLKREISSLSQEKEAKRVTIASHERTVHQADMLVTQKSQSREKFLTHQKYLDELEVEQRDTSAKLKTVENDIENASEPLHAAEEELSIIRIESSRQLATLQDRISTVSEHHKQLEDLTKTINAFDDENGVDRLSQCEKTIEMLRKQLLNIKGEIDVKDQKVIEVDRDLNESRTTERNINDNIRYIEDSAEIEKIHEELKSFDLEGSLAAWQDWNTKYAESKTEENRLSGEAAHMSGEISSLKLQIKGRERELKEDYKDVEKAYIEKLVDVQTSKLAQQDLETYQKALQAAIMKYHSIKMEEINDTLGQLWRDTYQGNDVDTIMIRADAEGAGNRTHNYRVVMLKDSVELDMRGRCSAGQKCLASILIRLALADSFSENCGIMALDEPTTNLDYENIRSLASSLTTLINQRRKQSNFQLIVITHDEDFLQMLRTGVGIDQWFHVFRDENYRSVIGLERPAM